MCCLNVLPSQNKEFIIIIIIIITVDLKRPLMKDPLFLT